MVNIGVGVIKMPIGNVIKDLRVSKGMTQRQLAEKLKIGYSTLGMYEIGKREPDLEMVKRFAEFFDVPTDHLIGYPSQSLQS